MTMAACIELPSPPSKRIDVPGMRFGPFDGGGGGIVSAAAACVVVVAGGAATVAVAAIVTVGCVSPGVHAPRNMQNTSPRIPRYYGLPAPVLPPC